MRRLAAVLAAIAIGAAGLAGFSTHAGATTLTCTAVSGQAVPPIGCGGYQSAYTAKGIQDMAATGNFFNAPVVSAVDSISNGEEDFMAFAVAGSTTDGPGGLGEYVIVSTPFGRLPGFTTQPSPGSTFSMNANDFCLSVAGEPIGPKGANREAVVLRSCTTNGLFTYGTSANPGSVTKSGANHYQVWAPAVGAHGLVMINKSLSRDFKKGNTAQVLDLKSSGPPGSRFIVYPENNGENQDGLIIGCTPPITQIISQLPVPPVGVAYALCP